MTQDYSDVVQTTREYYNSEDADNFYYHLWGGEDLHLGIYENADDPIFEASRKTVARMAEKAPKLDSDTDVLDIGGGFGGSARYLSHHYGCRVTVLNLSERENERGRHMNCEQRLAHLINIVDGNFEDIPVPDSVYDVVWSQDAILHSGRREQVIAEVARVLKPGGHFIFTDPMMADDCPDGVLDPILARIHLDTLGSPAFYRQACQKHGMEEVEFENLQPQLPRHYGRVLEETEKNEHRVKGIISDDYITRMKSGLQHWVDGGQKGYLTWGIFHFVKK